VKPLSGNAISSSDTDLHGMNGVVLNESLMELATDGKCQFILSYLISN